MYQKKEKGNKGMEQKVYLVSIFVMCPLKRTLIIKQREMKTL